MKKITTLLMLLVFVCMGAKAQVYVPGERVTTIEEGTKYFIYNTSYTPGSGYDKRWGFVYYDGSVKTYGGGVPETFTANDETYLFTFTSNGDDTYTLFNVGMEEEVGYSYKFTPWQDSEDDIKSGAQVRNDDGTYTPNEEISEENKVWTIYDEEQGQYWNGNNWTTEGANCFALWSNAHPYAIYTAIEKTTVRVVYNLYGPDGGFIRNYETEQVPGSPVVLSGELTEGCGFSPLGYNFTPSMENVGDTDCEIDVDITLKEGIVTDLADLSNTKAYQLTTERGTLGTNGEFLTSTNGTEYEASDFALINYEDKYYLWSIADEKWVANETPAKLTEDVGEIEGLLFDQNDEYENPLDLPLYFIGMGENGVNVNNSTYGVVVNSWVERDPGNKYVIKENGEFDPTNALTALDTYFHPEYTITYVVKDEAGNTLFTVSDIPARSGQQITTLPAAYQQPLFYTYNTVDVTVSQTVTTVEFTATPKEDAVFQFTADKSNPVWYTLTLKNQYYPTYEENDPNVTLPGELAEDETTQWAFVGNPYNGFKIVNKAAGTDLVLGSESAIDDGDTGANTYATLAPEGTQTFETWTIEASSYATNGFFIRNPEGHALNQRSMWELAYWTGGADLGSTFTASKVLSSDEKLAEAQHLLEELTAGSNEVQIGYPTADALAVFKQTLDEIAEAYSMGAIDESGLNDELREAIAAVQLAENASYTPRTDVYYTITNPRGSIVYDPEHAESVDGNGNEFLWYTNSLDKDDANHQWGFYEKDGAYYMYNVGKMLFANVSMSDPDAQDDDEGEVKPLKAFFSDGSWIFSKVPANMMFDAGEEDWVPTPSVRIQGEDSDFFVSTMSISTSYTGPVITYDAVDDGGVPMKFALATSEQNEEVTAAIEALLDPNGIELLDAKETTKNNAIYNLQGQRVNKAQKGVFIQNGKKFVVK